MSNLVARLSILALLFAVMGCSVFTPGTKAEYNAKLIKDPFGDFYDSAAQNRYPGMILRTKQADRAVEVELPGRQNSSTNLVIPVDNKFLNGKESRSPAGMIDAGYRDKKMGISDQEIADTFPKGNPEDDWKRKQIEEGLGLVEAEDNGEWNSDKSYLATLDYVKQLYSKGRFEAGLLEIDGLVRQYPTSPKLYEMRGTLMDRLGYTDLALKSWQQALELNPKNLKLEKFLERKRSLTTWRKTAGE